MNKKSLIVIAVVVIIGAGALVFGLSGNPANGPVASQSPVVSPTPISSGQKSYTLANVAEHKDGSSCWSTINGKVYDLTAWINQHPGGPSRILSICGKDGSSAFNTQHGGQARPANELTNFYIGNLISN